MACRLAYLLLATLAAICAASPAVAQVGGYDANFAPGPILNGALPGIVNAVAVQSDGKVIIGGDFTSVDGVARGRIARLNVNGTLDTSFATGAGADGVIHALALTSSGQVVIGGEFLTVNGTVRNRIAQLTTTGALDTSFVVTQGGPTVGANGTVWTVAISTFGIYVGGDFTQIAGANRGRIARLTNSGSVDSFFDSGGGANGTVYTIALNGNYLVAGGAFTTFNGSPKKRLVNISPSGLLTNFNSTGGPDGDVYTAAFVDSQVIGSSPRLVIGGDFLNIGTTGRTRFATFSTQSGSVSSLEALPVPSFDGRVRTFSASANGQFFVGGEFSQINEQNFPGFARLRTATTSTPPTSATYIDLDTTFPTNGGLNAPVRAVAVWGDKPVIGGEFSSAAGVSSQSVARLHGSSGSLPPATPTGLSATPLHTTHALVSFSTVSSATSYKLERSLDGVDNWTQVSGTASTTVIDTSLSPVTTFFYRVRASNINGDSAVSANVSTTTPGTDWTGAGALAPVFPGSSSSTINAVAVQPDGRILVAGSFSTIHGVARSYIARLLLDWTVDPTFDPGSGPDASVASIALQADGKVVIAGSFTSVQGMARKYIARLNADGTLDTGFNSNGSGPSSLLTLVALQPDGHILAAGFFTTFNGATRPFLARLNANGSFDASFNPAGISTIPDAVSVQRDGRILVGGFFTALGSRYVFRLQADGTADSTFDVGSIGAFVESVVALNNGKVMVGGSFTTVGGVTRNRVARLHGNGTLDTSFDPGVGPNNTVTQIVPQPDGKVIIAGSFTTVNGSIARGLARLNADGTLDPTFQVGRGAVGTINAVAVAPDTQVIVGGSLSGFGLSTETNLYLLNGDGWSAPPESPTGLTVTTQNHTRLLISWNDVSNEQSWTLERSADGNTGWSQVVTLPYDVTSFVDTIGTANTTYHYRLRANNGAGDSITTATTSGRTFTLFEQWKSDRNITLTTPDTTDFNGDGVPLLVEYALGLEPTTNNTADVPTYQILNGTAALSYRKYRSDVTYAVETSSNLETWSTVGVNQGSGPFPIAWKLLPPETPVFLRLRVTRP